LLNQFKNSIISHTGGSTDDGTNTIVNITYAKGDNTNNAGGEVSIIFNGVPDTTLSVVKTASVKSVWVGDTFMCTIVKKCLKCNKEPRIIKKYECCSFYIKFTCGVNIYEKNYYQLCNFIIVRYCVRIMVDLNYNIWKMRKVNKE
jgi:hypothetical protein